MIVLGIYGNSGSGKTALIEKLVSSLRSKYRIATIKKISEKEFTLDTRGKDTYRHAAAGAAIVVAAAPKETDIIIKHSEQFSELVAKISMLKNIDVLLVEGFRKEPTIKKVAVGKVKEERNTIFHWQPGRPVTQIRRYIETEIAVQKIEAKLSGLNCGECGFSCRTLAEMIRKKKKTLNDCIYYSSQNVSLKIDGNTVPLGRFAKKIVASTVEGLVSALKYAKTKKSIQIMIEK